jgi:hypothetical protein
VAHKGSVLLLMAHKEFTLCLEVPKDALRSREMGLTRVVDVEAHLLDRVGNARSGAGEVMESPSQAAVGSRGPMSEETLA